MLRGDLVKLLSAATVDCEWLFDGYMAASVRGVVFEKRDYIVKKTL